MNWRIITAVVLLSSAPNIAQACINPAGEAGDQVYNTTHNVMQYCNGSHWVAMGSHSGSGGGGSDNLGNHMAEQALDMGGFRIENLAPPSASTDAASKAYVDAAVGGSTPNLSAVLTAGNAAGNKKITGLAAPTVSTDATTKSYVDNALANKVSKAGDTMTGHLNVPLTPTANAHAASKQYVDNVASSGGLPACSEGDTLVMGAAVWECRSAPSCDGFAHGGVCWVLSSPGESCQGACYSRGGYNDATRTFAGSAGSDANCMSILTSLGAVFDPEEFQSDEVGLGLGCLVVTDGMFSAAYRDTYDTSAAAAYPTGEGVFIRRACACNARVAEDACTTGPVGATCGDGAVYLGTVEGNRIYVAQADETSASTWGPIANATADSMTDGLANTTWMAAQVDSYPAALACATKAPAGTWYLPAKDELALLWDSGNRKSPPGEINLTGIGIHASSYYWSSTEYNNTSAWVQRFSDGYQSNLNKTNSYRVRCVRR